MANTLTLSKNFTLNCFKTTINKSGPSSTTLNHWMLTSYCHSLPLIWYKLLILIICYIVRLVGLSLFFDLLFQDEHESRFSARGFFRMVYEMYCCTIFGLIIKYYVCLFQIWKDPRFTWSPSDYDGLQSIHVSGGKIWTPDMVVYNTHGELSEGRSFTDVEALILYDGTITFVPIANFVSTCIPNPSLYPFDTVKCETKIGSWTHSMNKIRIVNNGTGVRNRSIKRKCSRIALFV